jgi:hypothetical protein
MKIGEKEGVKKLNSPKDCQQLSKGDCDNFKKLMTFGPHEIDVIDFIIRHINRVTMGGEDIKLTKCGQCNIVRVQK